MINPKIVPQKFSFEKPTITNGKGETISYGISVTINIDAFKADKTEIKKDLTAIFADVLEYFDWFYQVHFLILIILKSKKRNILYTTTLLLPSLLHNH